MAASKASKALGGKKKNGETNGGASKVVTYRLNQKQRQAVVEYALALGTQLHRKVSNNEAIGHMIEHAKVPKAEQL